MLTIFKRKVINKCKPQDDPDVEIIKYFKAPLIIMIHAVRVNSLKTNEKIDILSKEIEGMPKNQVESFELTDTITKLESPLEDLKSRTEMRKKKKSQ